MTGRADHIIARINQLASISEDPTGITRRYGTPAAMQAANKVQEWMQAAGLQTTIDAIGNVRGAWLSENPAAKTLVIASHLDTVVNAGRWDGPLGVLTGLNILENLIQQKHQLPFHCQLIAFSEEEGVRFHTTYLGSKVVAGSFEKETLRRTDENGTTLEQAITTIGGDPANLSADAIPKDQWLGYFEIHIEQGPILYTKKIPVAPVTAIAGQVRATVTFTGSAGHAGTVPMDMRQDALCGAAQFILAVEAQAVNGVLATVGKLTQTNPASNTIPGETTCTVDIRSADQTTLNQAHEHLRGQAEAIGARRNLAVDWQIIQTSAPVTCDARMTAKLTAAIKTKGYEPLPLLSGAGHDAVPISAVAPVCMLFVRCYKGISHNPQEHVEREDLAAALAVAENFIINMTEI